MKNKNVQGIKAILAMIIMTILGLSLYIIPIEKSNE